jgi:hypothetical protein
MKKLDEMWTALAAYQPQADAEGHGKTWATMCREKTSDAARDAWSAAAYAADAADAEATGEAGYAADAAGDAGYAAGYAADAKAYADAKAAADARADRWAQKVIDGINKLKE